MYEMTGGYDATRDVLDDQDIMCRLYQLTDFHLIDECLYLQRMHTSNTQREIEINARIQKETVALYDRYVEPNALAWASRRGLKALYLGPTESRPPATCGLTPPRGPTSTSSATCRRASTCPTRASESSSSDFLPHVIGQGETVQRVLPAACSWRVCC